eukprot:jgi/Phyca11/15752/fgenesh1_pg.PHYCAscaffold_15_\
MAPSQRLLRSNKYPIKEEDEEEDLSEDSIDVQERDFTAHDEEDLEERSPLSDAVVKKLNTIANGWGTSYSSGPEEEEEQDCNDSVDTEEIVIRDIIDLVNLLIIGVFGLPQSQNC